MADKLVRKLTSKTTGAAITRANVVARPVTASGSSADIQMPETPDGSGIYATANQIDHDTYKIIVNGSDSLDEYTVEPGRVKVRSTGGNLLYPLIDRLLDAKLYLASLLGDASDTATAAQFRTALLTATDSDGSRRTLVLDQDATLSTSTVVSQGLFLDLNGRVLNLSANLTSSNSRIVVMNGRINVAASSLKIQGTSTLFQGCDFIGTGVSSFVQTDPNTTFSGCSGLVKLPGTEVDGVSTAVVSGGSNGFGQASQLKLTSKGKNSGSGRLTALQNWIDQTLSDTLRMGVIDWLFASKEVLDEWINTPVANRNAVASSMVANDGNAKWFPSFQQMGYYDRYNDGYPAVPVASLMSGVSSGIRCNVDDLGQIIYARVVGLATIHQLKSGNLAPTFLEMSSYIADNNTFDAVWSFMEKSQLGQSILSTNQKRAVVNAWKVSISGEVATFTKLAASATDDGLGYILSIANKGTVNSRLRVYGVKSQGATLSLGDLILLDVQVSNLNTASEPVSHAA